MVRNEQAQRGVSGLVSIGRRGADGAARTGLYGQACDAEENAGVRRGRRGMAGSGATRTDTSGCGSAGKARRGTRTEWMSRPRRGKAGMGGLELAGRDWFVE